MRQYIYKILIACLAFIIVFEFTIGKKINDLNDKTKIFLTKEGRKKIIISIKDEMKKAVDKENYLDNEEKILINKFINKIKKELNEVN